MQINLNTLYKPVCIDQKFTIPKEFYLDMPIKGIEDVYVKGKVYINISDEVEVLLDVEGIMYLEDAITLEEVRYPFSFQINEILNEKDDEFQEYLKNSKNILDIIEILWENIVLEVPISVTNASNAQQSGEGWQLNGEAKREEIDPRMAKLNELFKGGE